MSSAGDAPLTWGYDMRDGLPVLALGGTLTMAAGALLHDVVVEARQQHRAAVLIDVSALVVPDRDVVDVFASITTEALRWPDVLVLICAPTAEVTQLLGADVLDPRLLFDSVAAGRTAAGVGGAVDDRGPASGRRCRPPGP